MSKTVDDLVDEYNKHCDNPYSPIDIRAGIAAVIRALAPDDDEIAAYNRLSYKVQEQLKCECEYLPEDRCIRCSVVDALKCLETRYYEILGDAGNEKVAKPVCPTCKGAGALFGPYDPSDCTPCPECAPATDPAPAVCVWTERTDKKWKRGCCTLASKRYAFTICPSCGRPIKLDARR